MARCNAVSPKPASDAHDGGDGFHVQVVIVPEGDGHPLLFGEPSTAASADGRAPRRAGGSCSAEGGPPGWLLGNLIPGPEEAPRRSFSAGRGLVRTAMRMSHARASRMLPMSFRWPRHRLTNVSLHGVVGVRHVCPEAVADGEHVAAVFR